MPPRTRLASLALLALAGACEKTPARAAPSAAAAAPAAAAVPAAAAPLPDTIPSGPPMPLGDAAVVAADLDSTVTLRAWLASHAEDQALDTVPDWDRDEYVCRSALAPVQVGGRRFTRFATFGFPPEAGGEAPDTATVSRQSCALRAIWLVAEDGDVHHARHAADSLARGLDAVLGTSSEVDALRGRGNGRWERVRSWARPGRTIELGVDTGAVNRVVVVAFTAGSGLDTATRSMDEPDGSMRAELAVELAQADSALALTTPALAAVLRPLVARAAAVNSPRGVRSAADDSVLVRAVRAVRDAAPALDPPRRAAALFALDVGTWYTVPEFVHDDSGHVHDPLLPVLVKAGVPYVDASLDEKDGYTRRALHEAFAADSLGPAGRFALLALARSGWYEGPACASGGVAFELVIAHGEAALKRGDTSPLLHYYLGSAYNDIVNLAHREADDYVDPKDWRPREPLARRKAAEHLRLAILGLPDAALRRDARRRLTALQLGRPAETRYFCVYD